MRVSALGDNAVTAGLGDEIGPKTLHRVRAFAAKVAAARLPGVTDVVPAFASVTVFYDPAKFAAGNESPYACLRRQLLTLAHAPGADGHFAGGREVAIPVCYGGANGPDLETVAAHAGIPAAEVIRMHADAAYVVHAIGFAPGFPYLGGLPEKLHVPRLATPRAAVPAGSVGIGGGQTGVYPLETPGGWQVIGRTSLALFDPSRAEPSLLHVGDRVKFQAVASSQPRPPKTGTRHLISDMSVPSPAEGAPGERHLISDIQTGVKVLRPGMLTTVQDLGRSGHRAAGVPLSGAADPLALRLANWLVGNSADAAALEVTLIGPELEFPFEAVIAVTGARFPGIPGWQPVRVLAGTRLKLGAATSGCRGYVAIAGGIVTGRVLGSASTYLRGGLGGVEGRALREGDVLVVAKTTRVLEEHWRIDGRVLPAYSASPVVRVVRGAQADEFGRALFATEFKVTPRSDRMGVRLSGAALKRNNSRELISTAVSPGTVQIPPDGQPIVLMADAQTIGGYPQAAHVITVDLPLVAQLRPGDTLRFSEVSLDEAQNLLFARERTLALLHEGLVQKFH
ncbi:MAG TPA: 5-oxoprolinase subunit PxpB [Opitutaceae bacterium]|nr:5-oxoprolinase subunit PxpB [Opitutaceae bacterium]